MIGADFGEVVVFFLCFFFGEFVVVEEDGGEEGGFGAEEAAMDGEFFAFGSDVEVYYGAVEHAVEGVSWV